MSTTLTRQLTLIFAKAKPMRWSAVATAVMLAVGVALLIAIQSFQPSASNNIMVSTGSSDYALTYPEDLASGQKVKPSDDEIIALLSDLGVDKPRVGHNVYGINLDVDSGKRMNLRQDAWDADPFPGRYLLLEGRLPANPGEVAVSEAVANLIEGNTFTLAGDAIELEIVGIIRDEILRREMVGVIAPGTWELFADTTGTFNVTSSRTIFWNGSTPPEQTVANIAALFNETNPQPLEALLNVTVSRADLASSSPNLYSELFAVLLLLPFTSGLIAGWFGARFLSRIQTTLWQIGILRTSVAGIISILVLTVIASLIGIGAGVAIGSGLGPILDDFSSRKIGSSYGLHVYLPIIFLAALLGLIPGLLRVLSQRTEPKAKKERGWLPSVSQLLPAFSLVFVIAGITTSQSRDLNTLFIAPVLFGFAIVLFAPYLLKLIAAVRTDSLPVLLGLRRLETERRESTWITVGIASILMLSIAMLTLNFSMITTVNQSAVSRVPPGQVQLYTAEQATDLESLRKEIQELAKLDAPIRLSAASVSPTNLGGQLMVVDSVEDLQRLYGVTFTDGEILGFESGAIMVHSDTDITEDILVIDETTKVELPIVPLSSNVVSYPMFGGGAILRDVAVEHGMPIVQETWVFVDLSKNEEAALIQTPDALGFTPDWLVIYKKPDLRKEPLGNMITAFGAGILASLLVIYYAFSNTRKLRPTLASLSSVGVSSKWLSTVTFVQIGAVVGTAILFALGSAFIAVFISTFSAFSQTNFFIPWQSTSILVLTLILATAISVWWAQRKLAAAERSG